MFDDVCARTQTLLDHVYSCRFGTFFCDAQKEREELGLSQRTLSLWTYLQNCEMFHTFINPFYEASDQVLFPMYNAKLIRFWKSNYLRHCPEHIRHSEPIFDDMHELEHQYMHLQQEVVRLKQYIAELETQKFSLPRHNEQTTVVEDGFD